MLGGQATREAHFPRNIKLLEDAGRRPADGPVDPSRPALRRNIRRVRVRRVGHLLGLAPVVRVVRIRAAARRVRTASSACSQPHLRKCPPRTGPTQTWRPPSPTPSRRCWACSASASAPTADPRTSTRRCWSTAVTRCRPTRAPPPPPRPSRPRPSSGRGSTPVPRARRRTRAASRCWGSSCSPPLTAWPTASRTRSKPSTCPPSRRFRWRPGPTRAPRERRAPPPRRRLPCPGRSASTLPRPRRRARRPPAAPPAAWPRCGCRSRGAAP